MNTKVHIIGGGIAGLKCASILQSKEYDYLVSERQNHAGGHVADWSKLFPDGRESSQLIGSIIDTVDSSKIIKGEGVISLKKNASGKFDAVLSSGNIITSDSVIVASGFSLFDATKKEEYGYGLFEGVITNSDLESWFTGAGEVAIDSPYKIGFLHCVGSRDAKAGNTQCSKVCCITAVKQAIRLKEKFPKAQVYSFYMDLRMFGRGYEDLYLEAQSKWGIRFIRGRISEVSQDSDKRLVIKAEDTLSSKPIKLTLDLLVLMSGMVPDISNENLLSNAGIELGKDGFVLSNDIMSKSGTTTIEGVFAAGAVNGPRTIPDLMGECHAACNNVEIFLKKTYPDG
jgi:heterodisulfide reductase subunit A